MLWFIEALGSLGTNSTHRQKQQGLVYAKAATACGCGICCSPELVPPYSLGMEVYMADSYRDADACRRPMMTRQHYNTSRREKVSELHGHAPGVEAVPQAQLLDPLDDIHGRRSSQVEAGISHHGIHKTRKRGLGMVIHALENICRIL
eukprot:3825715-Pleurochrysis_carterae.AAC.1